MGTESPGRCRRSAGWGSKPPKGAGPQTGGMGSPAQAVVSAFEAPAGDGSPHRRGPAGWGDGEPRPGGGRCVVGAHRGQESPAAQAPGQETRSPTQLLATVETCRVRLSPRQAPPSVEARVAFLGPGTVLTPRLR